MYNTTFACKALLEATAQATHRNYEQVTIAPAVEIRASFGAGGGDGGDGGGSACPSS